MAGTESSQWPSLTVVVPTLNQGGTLDLTLQSILDHNALENLEVLVYDALSTDRTSEVLKSWEGRCSIFRENDRGQSDALQKGFQKAKGDIVCWLNSDDLFFPHACDRVRRLFAENSEYDVISGRAVFLNRDGSFRIPFPEGPVWNDDGNPDLRISVLQPSVFFRKSALERVGGINPRLYYVMDWDLWARFIVHRTPWLTVDEFFSAARLYPETKTASGGWTRFMELWRVARQHTGKQLPRSALGAINSWGLEDAPWPVTLLFHRLHRIRSFMRGKKPQPNLHQPQWQNGSAEIVFPWYGGRVSSVRCDLEIDTPGRPGPAGEVTVTCNGQSQSAPLEGSPLSCRIEGPFDEVLFRLTVNPPPETRTRILGVYPEV